MRRLTAVLSLLGVLFGVPPLASGYSVLAHEAMVDATWDRQIAPILKRRFPRATAAEVTAARAYAYGGYPDLDALYKQQARETDRAKREALLHQIQRLIHERVRMGPIFEYVWPSGIGPRVAEPALMLIDPYPWSAPRDDVRLKK